MASLLKDLFSLLKALLTLLFVVFLAATRPSTMPEGQTEDDFASVDARELSIPRVITLRFQLPLYKPTPEGGERTSIVPSYQRLAIYPQLNGQNARPLGWRADVDAPGIALKSTVEGNEVNWKLSVRALGQHSDFQFHEFIVSATFDEQSLEIFPLKFSVLIEMETPKITDELFAIWKLLSEDSTKDLASPGLLKSSFEIQITGDNNPPVSKSGVVAWELNLGELIYLAVHADDLSRPAWVDVFQKLSRVIPSLERQEHSTGSWLVAKLPPSLKREKRVIGLSVDSVFELGSDLEGADHPPIMKRLRVSPTSLLPPPQSSILNTSP